MHRKKLEEDIRCPLEYGMLLFKGKSKSGCICVPLDPESLRFSGIRSKTDNNPDTALAAAEKELPQSDQILFGRHSEIPSRQKYRFSSKGNPITVILQNISQWISLFCRKDYEHTLRQCPCCSCRSAV